MLFAVLFVVNHGRRSLDAVDTAGRSFEVNGAPLRQPGVDQVFDHLLLPVDGDAAPTRQLTERYALPNAVETQVDAVVLNAFAAHPVSQSEFVEQVDSVLFQQPRPNPRFDIVPAAVFQNYRVDPLPGQQQREHQPRRSCANYTNLRLVIHACSTCHLLWQK